MPLDTQNEVERPRDDAEEPYRLTFEQARIGIALADAGHRFIRVNPRFCEIVGFTAEELIGRTPADLSHPDDLQFAHDRFQRLVAGSSDFEQFDRRYIRKDGTTVWARVSLSGVRDGAGKLDYVIGVVENITAQRAAIAEIRSGRLKQSALAGVGALALGSAGLGFLFSRSAEAVREVLEVDFVEIVKLDGHHLIGVGHAGSADARERMALLAERMLARSDAVLAQTDEGEVFPFDPEGDEPESQVTAVMVRIDLGQTRWGLLAIGAAAPRTVSSGDVDFLRTLAALLGQAIERRRSEVELRIRAVQQSGVAELGRLTAAGVTSAALARACEMAMDGLGVEMAVILVRVAGAETFQVAAGDRRFEGTLVEGTHAGEVFTASAASVVEYGEGESPVGARNGVAAPIRTHERRFGVLSAYTALSKRFTATDVQFLESLALVLGEAMDREAARAELIESEQRLRSVVEGTSEIIFSISASGEIVSLNPAFEVVTGWRVDDYLGRKMETLLPAAEVERVREIFRSVRAEPRHVRIEVAVQGRRGVVLLDVAASPRMVEGEVVELYGFARDVTAERRLTSRLEQAGRLSALGRLAATVAHEFNNVLMAISPFAEILRREVTGERAVTAVTQIARAVRRGKRITEDILRFAQPAEPAAVALEVSSWLQALALDVQSLIGFAYEVRTEAPDDLRVAADPNQLHQAFVNLILNSRDAMPEGGTITIRAARVGADALPYTAQLDHPQRFAHFVVQDTGTGMASETLDHIFEPLFTTKKSGTGLGLPVAHQVVARHGGEIFVESEVGRGTAFHIFIPLAEASDVTALSEPRSIAHRCKRVLLVEDEEPVAAGLAALLQAEGIEVEVVNTGAAVLPTLERTPADAVVLDIGLPDIDGTVVFESLSRRFPTLPVVFSSGHGDATKLESYLARGNVGFLLKPYEIDALLQTLDRVVGR